MSTVDSEHLQLECVRISAAGVAEMDGERPLIFVPCAEVVRMEVRHGSAAERPLISAILGVVLVAMAVVPVVMLVRAMVLDGQFSAKVMTAVIFAIPGWWLLDLSIRRRFFVAVTSRRDTRKIVFHKTRDRRAIDEFLAAAKSRFGYP